LRWQDIGTIWIEACQAGHRLGKDLDLTLGVQNRASGGAPFTGKFIWIQSKQPIKHSKEMGLRLKGGSMVLSTGKMIGQVYSLRL
jgi:hypothetical protein